MIFYSAKSLDNVDYFIKAIKSPRATEITILRKKLPEYCVKMIDSIQIDSSIAVIFYKYPCTLADIISEKKIVPIQLLKKWSRQIAHTLIELHNIDIIHADIKPENILMTEPIENYENADCVICDFGISYITSLSYSIKGSGTEGYVSGEIKQGKTEPSASTDVHSLGRLMIKMLGSDPSIFDSDPLKYKNTYFSVQDLLRQMLQNYPISDQDKKNLIKLIDMCIKKLDTDRISLQNFLEHKLFSDCGNIIFKYQTNYYEDKINNRIQIQFDFNRKCKEYHNLFVCLKILAGKIFGGSLKKNFILQVIVEYLVKESLKIELNELKQKLSSICNSNDELLYSIEEKIAQYSAENGSEEFINLKLNEENLAIFKTFIENIQGYEELNEIERFSLKCLKNVEEILINHYNR